MAKHISLKDLAIWTWVDLSGEDEIIEDISVKKESGFQWENVYSLSIHQLTGEVFPLTTESRNSGNSETVGRSPIEKEEHIQR